VAHLKFLSHSRIVAAALIATVALISLASAPTATATKLATFNVAGTYKWIVPAGVNRVTFDVFGASGGYVASGNTIVSSGGVGGEAKGTFSVTAGQVYEIVVGSHGEESITHDCCPNGGIYGDGGHGGSYGAGGGGDSDVRIGGRSNTCASIPVCGVADRIIVAGGGGGGGQQNSGGAGGGSKGSDGGASSHGGSQDGGTPPCPQQGSLYFNQGCFGRGGRDDENDVTAGGGGGWVGGDAAGTSADGGAGGSGFISRLSISGSFPGGTRTGDGLVVIRTA
jgi:hypothetical protein